MGRLILSILFFCIGCTTSPSHPQLNPEDKILLQMDDSEIRQKLESPLKTLQELAKEAALTWWEASTKGSQEAFQKSQTAEEKLNLFLSSPTLFRQVRLWHAQASIQDPILKRLVEFMYLSMLGKQVEPEQLKQIIALEKKVERLFNTYRGQINGQTISQNDINKILRNSTDNAELQAAWEAQKEVGNSVAADLKKLVKLRNQVAQNLGFRDYYELRLIEQEQKETVLVKLFDELDELTREPFFKLKKEIDQRLAKRLNINPEDLQPWHYQDVFFQEAPDVFATGFEEIFSQHDTIKLSRQFFEGLDLQVKTILDRSDLFEKEGKSPHAFSIDIDRQGDIRILTNIVPGHEWLITTLHELGHATYDLYIDQALPWLLREAAHPLITEGIAMMFDHLAFNPRWAKAMQVMEQKLPASTLSESKLYMAFSRLLFSRWSQVMFRFEREMYANPDQNLNKLWWDLVERHQGLKRPENRDAPDYASKIHLVIVPVYYHNYTMGELFAAQLHNKLASLVQKDILKTVYVDQSQIGQYLKEQVFFPGARYNWEILVEKSTGKALSAQAFAQFFSNLSE